MHILRLGDRDAGVAEIRGILAALGLLSNTDPATDDLFDAATEEAVRAFQQRRGLSVDGKVGPETYRALHGAKWRFGERVLSHNVTQPMFGDDVAELQRHLLEIGFDTGRTDGHFGATTARALQSFQRDMGLRPDGVCGPVTLRALRALEARRVVGGRPQMLREMMALAEAGPSLLGKRIVLDPGHGGDDRGASWTDPDGTVITEADLVWDLTTRLEGRLTAMGVTTWLTRGRGTGRDDDERARFANEQGADLVLSIHVDTSPSERAHGIATYYYGAGEVASTMGERLADLVQRETVARTGMLDCRTHPKSWTILRMTSMPTVRFEFGYLSSPVDRPLILDPAFRDKVAEGLLIAIQRLYLPRELDPQTGVLRLADIAS